MKKSGILLLSLLLAGCITMLWSAHRAQMAMAEKLVRLHVLANSDSEEDQRLKLNVRDAVLAAAESALDDCADREQAEAALRQMLPELEQAAEETLTLHGSDAAVSAVLSRELYPKRTYDTFSLPAGEYLSLRVVIGEGAGRNWWCVVYPPLCLAATTEEVAQSAAQAGFNGEEIALITSEEGGAVVRFKLWEWLKNRIG